MTSPEQAVPATPTETEERRPALPDAETPLVRFFITLFANGLKAAISFLTGLLVAHSLGASGYGDLNFLLGSFTAINSILDGGSSFAFYTLLSGRRRGPGFFMMYFTWTFGVQFVGSIALIGLAAPQALVRAIWLGHSRGTVLLAFVASFMISQTWNAVSQMGEASRKTIVVQTAAASQAILHLLLVALAVWGHWLSVPVVLTLIACEYLAVSLLFGPKLLLVGLDRHRSEPIREVVREFVRYCRPLIIYTLVGFVYQFADRWMLQRFGGAAQQGYFSIGQQFANLSLLATTSTLSVFWKEVAEARASGDIERTNSMYRSVQQTLFCLAAVVSCLCIPHTRELLRWTVGSGFEAGALALALLFLYPVHQTAGQMQGTFYLATGDTRLYSILGIVFMLVSIPVTYFMLAPPTSRPAGLGLGALGVAVKMVVLQIAGVGVQTWIMNRVYGTRALFWSQLALLAGLLSLAWGSKLTASLVTHDAVANVACAGVIYLVAVAGILWRFPMIAGVSPARLHQSLARIGWLRR
jgi:O-antigen/teichoic acid export membrane protein